MVELADRTEAKQRADVTATSSAVRWLGRLRGAGFKGLMVLPLGFGLVAAARTTSHIGMDREVSDFIVHTVSRGDLEITVTESGQLESQQKTDVVCEIEDLGWEGSGQSGAQILSVVANGASVKRGDLLVEFNQAPLRARISDQELTRERARAELTQAKERLENQKIQNATALSEAQRRLDIAQLALTQYLDEQAGTYAVQLQEINRSVQEAEAKRLLEMKNLAGIRTLFKRGYRNKGQVEQAQISAQSSRNELARLLASRRELVEFTFVRTKLELSGAVESAEQSLDQTRVNNDSMLSQAAASLEAAEHALKKETEKLDLYRKQLAKYRIVAPHDGMVVYAVEDEFDADSRNTIRAGAFVRERQEILTLPDLSKMQVKSTIHEADLSRVNTGMQVEIRLDAFPERLYRGRVESVGTLPDQSGWMSMDNKVYETIVSIEGTVSGLRPGMTADLEIKAQAFENVLTIPVHAVVQDRGFHYCYVLEDGKQTRRDLELGMSNDNSVVVRQGLNEGERVIMNPRLDGVEFQFQSGVPAEAEFSSAAAEHQDFLQEPEALVPEEEPWMEEVGSP